jgi:hypothetical protein
MSGRELLQQDSTTRRPRFDVWLALTSPIAVLLAIAAGSGFLERGLYRDAPFFAIQAVAQDFISWAVVLPTIIVSAWLARRGSDRGRLVWLGALVYLVYSYAIDAFVVRYNPLFLVYVALLGCALYALIGGLVTADMAGIRARFTERTPVRTVSGFLALLAVTFYVVWLSEAVPAALAGQTPLSVQENGTPSNAIYVLDMAWILPACLIAAVTIARKTPLGYTLAGALLSFTVLLVLAVLSMVVFMVRAGYPVVIPQVVIFGVFFVLSAAVLVWYLSALQPSPRQDEGRSSVRRTP